MKLPDISLKQSVHGLEDGIITLSGPALAVSGILAGVDLVTGGSILKQLSWLALAWAITLLLSLDFNVLALGARSHKVYQSLDKSGWRKVFEIGLAVLIAAAISYVSIQMQSVIARSNSEPGITIDQAALQMGVNMIALTWERSILVLVLIFMSGWLREEQPGQQQSSVSVAENNNPSISEDTMQLILAKLAKLDALEQQIAEVASTANNTLITLERPQETPFILPTTAESKEGDGLLLGAKPEDSNVPTDLLPSVVDIANRLHLDIEDVRKVTYAYVGAQIARREICAYLKWGTAKYSSIVKPVCDAYDQRVVAMAESE